MMQSVEWILFFIKAWLQQLLPQSRCGDARGPFLMICSAYIFVFATVFGNFICHQAGAGGWEEAKKMCGPSPTQGWGGTDCSCETLSLARTSVCRLAINALGVQHRGAHRIHVQHR